MKLTSQQYKQLSVQLIITGIIFTVWEILSLRSSDLARLKPI